MIEEKESKRERNKRKRGAVGGNKEVGKKTEKKN